MIEERKKRLSAAILDVITILGEEPDGTLRNRVLVHMFEARSAADQLMGQGPVRTIDGGPMVSRMS